MRRAVDEWHHKITFRLTKLWAGQRSPEAQFNLGYLYNIGKGVAQDYAEAAKWYRKAADQGHAPAQYNLGFSYKNGMGVPQDVILAHMWFHLAALCSGWKGVQEDAIRARDAIASGMTPEQIAAAEKLVREWQPKKER